VRSNGAPLAVVADVTVNQDVAFAGPICLADTPCSRPLGVIDGLDGVVVWLTGDDPYPELTKSDLSRPLALRIQSGSGVTLLGHAVAPRVDSLIWGVAAASGQVASTPLGGVLAVEGWLTTFSSTCGPAPQPGPPIAPPFNCAIADVIAPEPGEAPHVAGWTSGPTALRVQKGAYNEFASNPDRIGPEPWRFGVYLVEHVANRNANCRGCDAWLLVGRLGG
jgi:hypothetical protein